MIGVFKGSSKDPGRAASGTVATGYTIGGYAIDCPEGVHYPGTPLVLLTHSHCDHLCGLSNSNLAYACSAFAAQAITKTQEAALLCSHLGLQPPRRPPSEILEDGSTLEGDGFSIEVLSTPGHSEGGLCFYVPEQKALFSGDTVFGSGFLPSVSLPTSSPEQLIHSYEKLAALEIERICPGHGSPFPGKGYIRNLLPALEELI
jgi:glyoxylase-like metal-dependent hydrolase (beta-lactamase superfamily II)